MQNVIINGVTYSGVPHISVPLAAGGGNAIFYDTSEATAQAAHVLSGYTAYGSGGKISGAATMPSISQDSTTKVLTIS